MISCRRAPVASQHVGRKRGQQNGEDRRCEGIQDAVGESRHQVALVDDVAEVTPLRGERRLGAHGARVSHGLQCVREDEVDRREGDQPGTAGDQVVDGRSDRAQWVHE